MPSMSTSASPAVNARSNRVVNFAYTFLYFSRFLLTAVPAQALLFLLFLKRPMAPPRVIVYAAVCLLYVTVAMVVAPAPTAVPLRNAIFFLSFLPPLLVMFSRGDARIRFYTANTFIIFLCVLTIVEMVLVNTSWGANIWFFPANHPHRHLIFGKGWYQRPSGFTGIASSTGFILVMSMVLADFESAKIQFVSLRNAMVVATLVILASGTGFVMFGIYLALCLMPQGVRIRRSQLLSIPFIAVALGLLMYGANGGLWTNELNKFSFDYVDLIIENKMIMLRGVQTQAPLELFFGRQVATTPLLSTMNDFGYFALFDSMGLVGLTLVLGVPFLFLGAWRRMKAATLFYFLSFVHYPALCSPPGAVLTAIYLFRLNQYRVASLHARRSRPPRAAPRQVAA